MSKPENRPSTPSADTLRPANRSLLYMVNEAHCRLQHLEISCQRMLPSAGQIVHGPSSMSLQVLQMQVAQLRMQLLAAVTLRESEDLIYRQAAQYAAAKGSANGVLHALFDQASAGKTAVLKTYLDTGSIPTRDGLRHWKLDLRSIRNEMGASLLHVAVGVSTARQNVKVKLVHLLLDQVGFDPNVRDVYGQTPLHIAAMSGYPEEYRFQYFYRLLKLAHAWEVVETLLDRGAEPLTQDRSGRTALSLVRTLSRPPEEVVQTLVKAESVAMRSAEHSMYCVWDATIADAMLFRPVNADTRNASQLIPLSKALMSALFLQGLSRFVLEHCSSAFADQTTALVHALLKESHDCSIDFDQLLKERVSMLFHVVPTGPAARVESVFSSSLFRDLEFINDLKIEADRYNLSLITPALTTGVLTGPSWIGVLSKLIQKLRLEMVEGAQADAYFGDKSKRIDDDVIVNSNIDNRRTATPPSGRVSNSYISTPYSLTLRPALHYADQTTFVAQKRAVWYYAVLFKASTHAFPGTLTVTPGSNFAVVSEDVAKYFPLEDRLAIGSTEYFAIGYDPATRGIQLDRNYDGKESATLTAYLTGGNFAEPSPYLAVKRIWEQDPGNKYEDQMSSEQELFQDYQFLDPESEYEVAIKLGPIPSGQGARDIVAEWKQTAKHLFDLRECTSGTPCCQYYCPQRSGHSICLGTLATIGQGLARRHLGRPTFSKPSKPRASLQRLQDRFKGTEAWPGSPSLSAMPSPP